MLEALVKKYNLDAHVELLDRLSHPCLEGRENGQDIELACSKVGGYPHVNEGFIWPNYQGVPLEFIAQLNLSGLEGHNLPDSGLLLFFYATGLYAYEKKDKGIFRVIHIQDKSNLQVQEPEHQYKKRLWGLLKPTVIPQVFDEYSIAFHNNYSLPDLDNDETFHTLSVHFDDNFVPDSYIDLKYEVAEGVLQIGGHATPVQSSDLAAGAASIMGRGTAADWELLLEVDSLLGFMWGDTGRLYYYIHKDDLAEANFSNVWMSFQCC